jgi:hypothetical protein
VCGRAAFEKRKRKMRAAKAEASGGAQPQQAAPAKRAALYAASAHPRYTPMCMLVVTMYWQQEQHTKKA